MQVSYFERSLFNKSVISDFNLGKLRIIIDQIMSSAMLS